jgi:hypothetical protein
LGEGVWRGRVGRALLAWAFKILPSGLVGFAGSFGDRTLTRLFLLLFLLLRFLLLLSNCVDLRFDLGLCVEIRSVKRISESCKLRRGQTEE